MKHVLKSWRGTIPEGTTRVHVVVTDGTSELTIASVSLAESYTAPYLLQSSLQRVVVNGQRNEDGTWELSIEEIFVPEEFDVSILTTNRESLGEV